MKIIQKAGVMLFLAGMICGVSATTVYAQKNMDFNDYIAGGETEGEISIVPSSDGKDLVMDFLFDKDGYHTVTAFCNDKLTLKVETGVTFDIRNQSDEPARMNFALIDNEGVLRQVKDGYYVRLLNKTEEYSLTENGCFEIPAEYAGKVEIPFELFLDSTDEIADMQHVMGYGLVCVTEGNVPYQVTYQNFVFENEEKLKEPELPAFLQIKGADAMLKSDVGDSVETYTAQVCNMLGKVSDEPVSFSLDGASKTVLVEPEGEVTVIAGCKQESFVLQAKTKEGMYTKKIIELKESWVKDVLTDNGYDASIPNPAEISSIAGKFAALTEENVMLWIRIIGVTAVAITLLYYVWIRSKREKGGE